MRTAGAALFAIGVFVIGWVLTGLTMTGIALLAYKSGGSPGAGHIRVTWILGPGVGGYLAIHVTARVFERVNIGSVFASFVTLASVLTVIVILAGLAQAAQQSSWGPLFVGALQCAAIFVGAFIAKHGSD